MSDFTQDDAFELDGCGKQAVGRSVLRQLNANVNRMVRDMLNRRETRADQMAEAYENGFADGKDVLRSVEDGWSEYCKEIEQKARVEAGCAWQDAADWKQRALKAEAEAVTAHERGYRAGYAQCEDDNDLRPDV